MARRPAGRAGRSGGEGAGEPAPRDPAAGRAALTGPRAPDRTKPPDGTFLARPPVATNIPYSHSGKVAGGFGAWYPASLLCELTVCVPGSCGSAPRSAHAYRGRRPTRTWIHAGMHGGRLSIGYSCTICVADLKMRMLIRPHPASGGVAVECGENSTFFFKRDQSGCNEAPSTTSLYSQVSTIV